MIEPVFETKTYIQELTKVWLEAGIPIWKLNNVGLKDFFLNKHGVVIPSYQTLYNNIDFIYECGLNNLKAKIGNNNIYVMLDETHDALGRYVLNVLVGVLDGSATTPYLLSTIFLKKTNHITVTQGTITALNILWRTLKYDKLYLLLTDQAPYMIKVGTKLKELFPNMLHITCLVHSLNLVCQTIKCRNMLTNELISQMKAALSKSHIRRQAFEDICDIKFPPNVIESRWHLWMECAFYYGQHFSKIKEFILEIEDDSYAVKRLKYIISVPELEEELVYIYQFKFLNEAMIKLEKSGLKLSIQMEILETVKMKLKDTELLKLERSLAKNPDIYNVQKLSVDKRIMYIHAPLTTVDIERSFSLYRNILSDRRRNLTEEHIAMLNFIEYNTNLDNCE